MVNNSFLHELDMEVSRDRLFSNSFLPVIVILLGYSFVEVSGQCGSHLTSSSGSIQSPNYPNPYPAGQQCIWTVSVDGSVENIRISFSAFKLEPKSVDGQCVDYVAIYSLLLSKDEDAVMEAKLCGGSIPLSIKIAHSSMTVQFISDSVSASSVYTGFSLRYQANFKDASKVSQATAGIVAAIFCAIVFIGVGMLRCIMMGACNVCNVSNPQNNDRNRQVVGTSESYAFQADFPPSYSTVMDHPERFPTPEASPQILTLRNGTVTGAADSPSMDQNEATFSLHSSSNESSDDDDEDTPPPPYPGNVSSEDEVNIDFASNDTSATNRATDNGSDHVAVVTSESEMDVFNEIPSLVTVMDNEQVPSVSAPELPVDLPILSRPDHGETDLSTSRGEEVELSETCMSHDDNTEEIII